MCGFFIIIIIAHSQNNQKSRFREISDLAPPKKESRHNATWVSSALVQGLKIICPPFKNYLIRILNSRVYVYYIISIYKISLFSRLPQARWHGRPFQFRPQRAKDHKSKIPARFLMGRENKWLILP